jgi:hypothetical protein
MRAEDEDEPSRNCEQVEYTVAGTGKLEAGSGNLLGCLVRMFRSLGGR